VFLISYLAVQVAHWRLLKQTRGSRVMVATGFVAMAAVFVYFVWTTALAQPWSVALIAVFIACSAVIELLLGPKSLTAPQVKAALIR
jgi:hypothetical protein